jgi:hypothetical protein
VTKAAKPEPAHRPGQKAAKLSRTIMTRKCGHCGALVSGRTVAEIEAHLKLAPVCADRLGEVPQAYWWLKA